mmetsp:Transcript_32170/g.58182  ORF Transcript_32170/g.58182 Transcript_32170/m.58182 type:complete len:205 (+) Transcript_32170:22-636(+)|eukprot:CAMPEP_0202486002 /NCGR_PEP_ID=MMETSP1361-20130828/4675_1 /ASSEMBLY_ACC=CAM_ASM_000849 /TAXON_ID=210615 /ORGANISM="Staurosira complex sp., Strain CCMP2646" /LENGTH=204 /DNA_ID=CAMNT_0049115009 /DNA_START=35 /DNA_END=649 /DNA_ORIENTATION=-
MMHTLSTRIALRRAAQSVPLSPSFVKRRHVSSRKKKIDPFKVLGISREDPYTKAKERFIKIAMSHHPDTNQAACEKEREAFREGFIRARRAFEQLTSGDNGEIILKQKKKEMEDFDAWFKNETGHDTPFQFMDAQTMKEVAEMEDTIGHGLDRDGGMWMLASMVSNAVKTGQSGANILQLEAGQVQQKNEGIDGVLRRKRRTRR